MGCFGILSLRPWAFEWFTVERDQELIDKLIDDVRSIGERLLMDLSQILARHQRQTVCLMSLEKNL